MYQLLLLDRSLRVCLVFLSWPFSLCARALKHLDQVRIAILETASKRQPQLYPQEEHHVAWRSWLWPRRRRRLFACRYAKV